MALQYSYQLTFNKESIKNTKHYGGIIRMKKLNLKKIIAMGLITTSVLAVTSIGASATWRQDSNGWYNSKGSSYSRGWENIGGSWYYFDSNGYMKTGWLNNGKWYHFSPSGAMQTGWIQDGGSWYYLKSDGTMVTENTLIDGKLSRFDINGKWLGYANSVNQVNTNNGGVSQTGNSAHEFSTSDALEKFSQIKGAKVSTGKLGKIHKNGKVGYYTSYYFIEGKSGNQGSFIIFEDGTYKEFAPGVNPDNSECDEWMESGSNSSTSTTQTNTSEQKQKEMEEQKQNSKYFLGN